MPDLLVSQLTPFHGQERVTWLSPLEADDYAEYRDQSVADLCTLSVTTPHSDFWPNRGPQWDALGVTDSGGLVLVEAKAHIGEMLSAGSQASAGSAEKIRAALEETRRYVNGSDSIDWSGPLYQYANRLAALYYFRVLNDIPAWLVYCLFVGDADVGGPGTADEWRGAVRMVESLLGVARHRLSPFILHAFVETRELEATTT